MRSDLKKGQDNEINIAFSFTFKKCEKPLLLVEARPEGCLEWGFRNLATRYGIQGLER